jgi:hypothetical protein
MSGSRPTELRTTTADRPFLSTTFTAVALLSAPFPRHDASRTRDADARRRGAAFDL